jgi:hypothetical protein
MRKIPIWSCVVDQGAWSALFLFKPTVNQVKEAMRDTIAEESRLSQLKPSEIKKILGEKMVKKTKLDYKEVMQATNEHIAGLAKIVKQKPLEFELTEELVWEK